MKSVTITLVEGEDPKVEFQGAWKALEVLSLFKALKVGYRKYKHQMLRDSEVSLEEARPLESSIEDEEELMEEVKEERIEETTGDIAEEGER